MSIQELIQNAVTADPTGDPFVLAKRVYSQADAEDLIGLIAEEVAHEQRHRVRAKEHKAFLLTGNRVMPEVSRPEQGGQFAALLQSTFKLGDGNSVRWGQASVAQHRQRIEMLEKLRAGIDQTINRHQEAIRLITEAGVDCLDDLSAEAA